MSKPGQQFEISPQQAMTPQRQQAYRLLQLPALELQSQIELALDANVMLETDEAFDATWALDSALDAQQGAGLQAGFARPMAGRIPRRFRGHARTITSRGNSSWRRCPTGRGRSAAR